MVVLPCYTGRAAQQTWSRCARFIQLLTAAALLSLCAAGPTERFDSSRVEALAYAIVDSEASEDEHDRSRPPQANGDTSFAVDDVLIEQYDAMLLAFFTRSRAIGIARDGTDRLSPLLPPPKRARSRSKTVVVRPPFLSIDRSPALPAGSRPFPPSISTS